MQWVNAKADMHENEDGRLSEVSVQVKELAIKTAGW